MRCNCFLGLRRYGLYSTSSSDSIPLKSLNIHVTIINNIARVFYTQTYKHTSQVRLETEFLFPISPDDCFDSFEAKFNNTTIKGIIKEKEQAQEEYKSGVEQGKTVAYSEITGEASDVMKVCIGNIPPDTEIEIKYSYIQKLESYSGKLWCFKLFSTVSSHRNTYDILTERFTKCVDGDVPFVYPALAPNGSQAYPWNIKVEIQSPSPITMVKSPFYKINTLYGNEKHTCSVVLDLLSDFRLTKDFVLIYSNTRESPVDSVMTPFEDGYCAMMTLVPDFEQEDGEISLEITYENYAKAKEPEPMYEMDSIRGEYIFLIDRSGSMLGERISMAKRSLLLFLKSLPKDSLYNVVSFGVGYKFLSNSSIQYSQESLEKTSMEIENFAANMGGTEIYTPLQKVFSAPQVKGYPRFIFLLTDGAVENVNKVYNLIKENSEKACVYTIGIGKECVPEFIAQAAVYGKGRHAIVSKNSEIMEKVIDLLGASFSPSYSDFSLYANNFDALVKGVSPSLHTVPFLLDAKTLTVFLFIRKEAFSEENSNMLFTLEMYDSQKKTHRKIEINLDADQALENDMISKLAIHSMIKTLEAEKKNLTGANQHNIVWMDEKEIGQTLLEYSLKYGILCEATAFFCEIKSDNTDQVSAMPQKKIVTPSSGPKSLPSSLPPIQQKSGPSFKAPSKPFPSFQPQYTTLSQNVAIKPTAPPMKMPTMPVTNQSSHPPIPNNSLQQAPSLSFNPLQNKYLSPPVGAVGALPFKSLGAPPKTMGIPPPMMAKPAQPIPGGSWGNNAQSTGSQQIAPSKSDSVDFSKPPLKFGSVMPAENNMIFMPMQAEVTYIDVIMKQNIEGFWDCEDKELKGIITKSGKQFPSIPKELKMMDNISGEAWMTILVLVWLEVVCQNDKKAWRLIHQKGCEWLKSKGINYNNVKEFGIEAVKC